MRPQLCSVVFPGELTGFIPLRREVLASSVVSPFVEKCLTHVSMVSRIGSGIASP